MAIEFTPDKEAFPTIEEEDFVIEFAPGCFDDWDGTQEELDKFIEFLTESARNGTLQDFAEEVDTLEEFQEIIGERATIQ